MIYVEDRALLVCTLGKTFSDSMRWTTSRWIYKKISAITQDAPCVLEVPGHNVLDQWPILISNVKGMLQLNEERWHIATVIDADHIELNDVVSSDYPAYAGGGNIRFKEPADLSTIASARMQWRPDAMSATVYAELTTANGGIVFDVPGSATNFHLTPVQSAVIQLLLPAEAPANRAPDRGVFDIELVTAAGAVPYFTDGDLHMLREVTR